MRRRDFLSVVAGATWPLAARAQQSAMPVIGFFSEAPDVPHLAAAFRQGLAEAGYVDGKKSLSRPTLPTSGESCWLNLLATWFVAT
jgi:hypothetical protein